ncbi:MAG: Trk system potassium transporter TrkA [Bacteroidota bacterium]
MRIIIAGGGDVGFHIAKLLAFEKQDIAVIDTDPNVLKYVANHLDVATIKGSSTSYTTLDQANISKADLLIAATSSEETNITTAMIGKHLGAKKTVARISNIEYLLKKDKLDIRDLGIDEIISPESLAAREIQRLLKDNALTDAFEFNKGLLKLIGVIVDENSRLYNKTLSSTAYLNPENNFLTVAILRGDKTIIPRGETRFQTGDHAYFIAQPEGVDRVLDLSGKQKLGIKNIMILGGSKVGYNAARRLSEKYNIKLVEKDRDKSFELADKLPDVLVINGDGRDVELLKEEGLDQMDAFLALTGDSETNIISCLVAKNNGVGKTISLVENIDYIHLSQNIGVDTMINKKLIAANFIFRYIRKGEVLSIASVHGVDAEILEFEVKDNCRITEKRLKEINFPHTAIIGGVIRNGKGYTAMGDFQFLPKDRVVVLALPDSIHQVESFFK